MAFALALFVALLLAAPTLAPATPADASKQQLRKAVAQAKEAKRRAQSALELAEQALAAASGAVTADAIADGAVTAPKLGAGAVTSGKIAPGALDAQGLFGPDVIGSSALAPGAVGTAETGIVPAARVTFTGTENQSVADTLNTAYTVVWDQEVFDTQGLHAGSATTLVAPVAGIYQASATVELNNDTLASQDKDVTFFLLLVSNGTDIVAQTQNYTTNSGAGYWNPVDLNVSGLVSLGAGGTVEAQIYQYSGTGVALPLDAGDDSSDFGMTWTGPQAVAP